MSRYKPAILVIGVLNLIAGIAAILIGPMLFALAAGVSMSWYCELDHAGVINHEKLAELHGASFAGDWANVPNTMNGDLGGVAMSICTILSVILMINGLSLCTFCGLDSWRTKRANGRIARGHCPQCDYDLTGNKSGICSECGHLLEVQKR